MRSDRERLLDILEAIDRIGTYSIRGRQQFEQDELIQNWMVRHIQIIGEAVARLSDEVRSANSAVPWKEIVGMRNVLVHGYFGIDLDAVWEAVAEGIPASKPQIRAILDGLGD